MLTEKNKNNKVILAKFDENIIRVYQVYSNIIADEAVKLGTFGKNFKMERMTWIKPSFLWMMYRSGWAKKEGQNRILAIDIKRKGFEEILKNVVLSTFKKEMYESRENWKNKLASSEVRCQWDPDRDIYTNPLDRRAIQLGIRGNMVKSYVNDWIVNISDITEYVLDVHKKISLKTFNDNMLPEEKEYPLELEIKKILGIKSNEINN